MLTWLVGGGDAEAELANEVLKKDQLTKDLVHRSRFTDGSRDRRPLTTIRVPVTGIVGGATTAPHPSSSTPAPDGTVSSMDLLSVSMQRPLGTTSVTAANGAGAGAAPAREYVHDVVGVVSTVLKSLGLTSSVGQVRPFTVAEVHERVVDHRPATRPKGADDPEGLGDGLVVMDISIPDVRKALEVMRNVHGPDLLGNYYWIPSQDSVRRALQHTVREGEKNRFMRLVTGWRQLMMDALVARKFCVRVCEVGPMDFVPSHTVTIPSSSPSSPPVAPNQPAPQETAAANGPDPSTQRYYAIRPEGAVWLFHQCLSSEGTLEFFLRVRHTGPEGRLLHEGLTIPFCGKDEDSKRDSFRCDDVPQEFFYGEVMVSLLPYYP